ncbi:MULTISPECIES: tripartite tricarboxylate transporter TctB family protein [Bacteria]
MSTTDGTDVPITHDGARPARSLEIALAIVALAFTATYLFLSTRIELRLEAAPGQLDARSWPLLLGTLGVAMSVVLLVIAIARPAPSREDLEVRRPGGVVRVIVTFAITAAFVFVWSLSSIVAFGYRFELFPIVTAVYLFVLMLVYGQRKRLGLVIYPLALTAFIYVLFGMLLRIPL